MFVELESGYGPIDTDNIEDIQSITLNDAEEPYRFRLYIIKKPAGNVSVGFKTKQEAENKRKELLCAMEEGKCL